MWDKLKQLYQQHKPGPHFNAYDAFFNIQKEEELQCMALIHALPTEYSGFITSLFLLDKLTLASLCTAFHNQENQVQLWESSSTDAAITMKAAVSIPIPATTSNTCS
ncbi:hypothetical protein BDQ12DRAFT_725480 [Crucibulum laeve]|uniref:Uncharacterized protein n=1 Tax=Crucibulum laeve TaxID=68775 RepID=A0A5C3LUY6_9AGAR|nr:hypothetical protein BDQ12DRAFT_725480 [Crucibulum laeve]